MSADCVVTLSVPGIATATWIVRRTELVGRYASEKHLGVDVIERIVHNASCAGELGDREPILVQLLTASGEVVDSARVAAGLCRCEACHDAVARKAHRTEMGEPYQGDLTLDDFA